MRDPYTFTADWPITDDTVTLRDLIANGIDDLDGLLNEQKAYLLEPPVWTVRIQKGCTTRLHAEAPADLRANRIQVGGKRPAECGTESGMKRHRRRGETPCVPCRGAHNAGEQRRSAARRERDSAVVAELRQRCADAEARVAS